MEIPSLPSEFEELLRLFNDRGVRYLLVGGHAVGIHGYVRFTGDLDLWIAVDPANTHLVVDALRAFGFEMPELTPDIFQREHQIVRMGVPPMRVEIHTSISGVEFDACYGRRLNATIAGFDVPVIGLEDLRANKAAAGRTKDKLDLENLAD